MHKVPSSRFRTMYASLTDSVEVTVNGRVIGTWTPVGTPKESVKAPIQDSSWTRTFTPAPKPGKR